MNTGSYLFIITSFAAALLLLEALFLSWRAHFGVEARRIKRRLQGVAAGPDESESAIDKRRKWAARADLDRLLKSFPKLIRIDRLLQQAGVAINVAAVIGLTAAAAIALGLGALLLRMPWIVVIVAACIGGALPGVYVLNARRERLTLIDEQLPDALELMSRALQAGHAFPSALQMAGEELPQPIGNEFHLAFEEVNYGIPVHTALENLAARVPSTDLQYFVVAVLIQRESGGNLSELLNSIAGLIRSRLTFQRSVRVLTAEGRLSAQILAVLPFALAAAIQVVSPGFLSILWQSPKGLHILEAAAAAMLVGFFWMWRLTKLRV